MKDLGIVIGSLGGCIRGICSNCEYGDSDCHRDELMKDALEYLKRMDDLRKDMWDLTHKNHQLVRSLKLTRAQRNSAWEKLARITGEREAAWLAEEAPDGTNM